MEIIIIIVAAKSKMTIFKLLSFVFVLF